MKIRDIILDFTSLLDVVMIILFFFVLFSTFDADNAIKSAEEAKASYESLIEENKQEQAEWREQAEKEWEKISDIDKNAADNQQALLEYDKGAVLAFNLQNIETSDIWTLSILSGDTEIGEIISQECDDLEAQIIGCMQKSGLKADDVIIGTLTYDGNSFGTEGAVPFIRNVIDDIQQKYTNLYFAIINVSK